MHSFRVAVLVVPALLSACASTRKSEPQRTADEELLISSAVDHALDRLNLDIPAGTKIWVDPADLDGYDQKYAMGAIKDYLLHHGGRLMADRGGADTVIEIRAGALSTNSHDLLIGIPALALPVPMVGATQTPEVALVKRSDDQGVAKLGITAYDAKSGELARYSPPAPAYGYSTSKRWIVLSLFDWTERDTLPKAAKDARDRSSDDAR